MLERITTKWNSLMLKRYDQRVIEMADTSELHKSSEVLAELFDICSLVKPGLMG